LKRESLSEREKQVTAHLVAGLRVAGIARELCVSPTTVRNHLKRVFSKLDVHSQAELIELVRRDAATIAPYQPLAGLLGPAHGGLGDELVEIDRATQERIEACAAFGRGIDVMKAILRAVLPLDEARRHEWRVRLAARVLEPEQRAVRELSGELRQKWSRKPLLRISDYQARGWIRPELDAEDVHRELVAAVHAAVMALLANDSPEEQRRQLAAIDRVLETIALSD
jgi:DNA-binding CsgD family transcriptional regulator